jgi:hypothetical protein
MYRIGGLYSPNVNYIHVFDAKEKWINIPVGESVLYLGCRVEPWDVKHMLLFGDRVVAWVTSMGDEESSVWWDEVCARVIS